MINVELKVIDDPLRQKIEKIRLYRLSTLIQTDVDDYLEGYFKYDSGLRFQFFKAGLSEILNKYNMEYNIEYLYDKYTDNVKVYIGKNFVLDINIIRDSEFHI